MDKSEFDVGGSQEIQSIMIPVMNNLVLLSHVEYACNQELDLKVVWGYPRYLLDSGSNPRPGIVRLVTYFTQLANAYACPNCLVERNDLSMINND